MDRFNAGDTGRTPRGVRGLKFKSHFGVTSPDASHPSRGAWIEISLNQYEIAELNGRTPRGVRGLKCPEKAFSTAPISVGRTPRGVRGLKSPSKRTALFTVRSHPSRGAWIEIAHAPADAAGTARRTPRGVRGLKYYREPGSPDRRGRTPRGVRGLKSEISAYSEKAWRRTPRGVRGLKFYRSP